MCVILILQNENTSIKYKVKHTVVKEMTLQSISPGPYLVLKTIQMKLQLNMQNLYYD